jgi:cell division cycle 2-like
MLALKSICSHLEVKMLSFHRAPMMYGDLQRRDAAFNTNARLSDPPLPCHSNFPSHVVGLLTALMASKASRWAADDAEDAAFAAQRKREKEEKRRLKEEKARQAAEAAQIPANEAADGLNHNEGAGDRPSKRRRLEDSTASQSGQQNGSDDDTTLLTMPSRGFGPAASVDKYTILNPIEEGSYGHVSRAKSNTGEVVALKKLKMDSNQEGFPVTALREIQTLRACSHPHVVALREVVMGPTSSE